MQLGMPRPPLPMAAPTGTPPMAPMRPMPAPMKKPGLPHAALIRQAILAKLQGAMK